MRELEGRGSPEEARGGPTADAEEANWPRDAAREPARR